MNNMCQTHNTSEQQRTIDVGPDRLPQTLSELYIMSTATTRWKGPRHLQYDSYDARQRSFINWPHYLQPTPTIISAAGFFYTGKPCTAYPDTDNADAF